MFYLKGVHETAHKAIRSEDQPARNDHNRKKSIEVTAADIIGPKEPVPHAVPALQVQQDVEGSLDDHPLPPAPTSASYAVPGSSGTLKETHIFTPSNTTLSSPQIPRIHSGVTIEYEYEKPPAGIIINENVVKKEYRDVVYDPEKLKSTASVEAEDFSEFQSVESVDVSNILKETPVTKPLSSQILEPVKAIGAITINWPDPGKIVDTTDLDDFCNYTPISNTSSTVADSNNEDKSEKSEKSTDSTKSKEHIGSKKFSKPVIGISPSEYMFSSSQTVHNNNENQVEFSDFQSITPNEDPPRSPPIIQNIPDVLLPTHKLTVTAPATFILPLPDNPQHKAVPNNRANAVPPISSVPIVPLSAVPTADTLPWCLVPQIASQSQPKLTSDPCVNWPDPGIDPDEMARLEAIFPQPKKSSQNPSNIPAAKPEPQNTIEDEWTDFVSVSQPQLPITNILSQNLQKHQDDDDDWSEFVSSTAPTQTWNNSGPNFTSWNAPSQTAYSSTLFKPSTHQVSIPPPFLINTIDFSSSISGSQSVSTSGSRSNDSGKGNGLSPFNHHVNKKHISNGKLPMRTMQNQSTASIISLPDSMMGFVAPKTLVNLPKTNFSKK